MRGRLFWTLLASFAASVGLHSILAPRLGDTAAEYSSGAVFFAILLAAHIIRKRKLKPPTMMDAVVKLAQEEQQSRKPLDRNEP